MITIASQMGILFMRLLAGLPLSWIRAMGWALGRVLYVAIGSRRRVVKTNLALCFPQWSTHKRDAMARRVFVCVAQAWLDRSWLWHGRPGLLLRRLRLTGAVGELQGNEPTLVFAPHFVGIDASWTALTQQLPRAFMTIYTGQANKVVDAWIRAGRQRFGSVQLFQRVDGVKAVVTALRQGVPLCLLPDMNYGLEDSVFVPFYGVPAATVPSLSRFARLGRAKVLPVLARLTPQGYDTEILPAWRDFPSGNLVADTALMNQRLQTYIDGMPEQYYWVHKRFKSRPPGMDPVY